MSKSFCVLPWIHLATHPDGAVSLCCRVDFNDGIGMAFNKHQDGNRDFLNINKNSLESIVNSDSFKSARKDMLAGRQPEACKDCYLQEKNGIKSKRLRENSEFKNIDIGIAKQLTSDDGSIKANFKFVELRLGNICNLKCRTCNPTSSIKWKTDYDILMDKLDFVRKYQADRNFSWPEEEIFWKQLLADSKELELIYINGGEPTLIKRHWKFLEELISQNRSADIALTYNTNMTHINENCFDIWKKFKSVSIGASIDDIGIRNSYIRYPTKWDTVVNNLLLMKKNQVDISITQTVSAYNLMYLGDLFEFATANGVSVAHNYVYDPDFLSPMALPLDMRKKIFKSLEKQLPDWLLEPLVSQYSKEDNPILLDQFIKYNNELDEIRKENFSEVFSELNQEIIKYKDRVV